MVLCGCMWIIVVLCSYKWFYVFKSGFYVVKSGFMWLKVV